MEMHFLCVSFLIHVFLQRSYDSYQEAEPSAASFKQPNWTILEFVTTEGWNLGAPTSDQLIYSDVKAFADKDKDEDNQVPACVCVCVFVCARALKCWRDFH